MSFLSVLRAPDAVYGAVESSPFDFEEKAGCPVKYEYLLDGSSARVIVYPSGEPVKYLKFRWNGDLSSVDKVYGDTWERCYFNSSPLSWQSVNGARSLPWFSYIKDESKTMCYGVKTGANCFASWHIDTHGVTLFMNLTCGVDGTDIKEPLLACEVVELCGNDGESSFAVAKEFSTLMCENPKFPKEPVYGVNNWYWAYGNISEESVLREADYLIKMTSKCEKHRPYMIIDDGWQLERTYGYGSYIGGPWTPNAKFGDMKSLADKIHAKGAKAGIWIRPLLTKTKMPDDALLVKGDWGGEVLDPSHPATLELIKNDVKRIKEWGYDLIKHDFTTIDMFGSHPFTGEKNPYQLTKSDRKFYDNTRTNAQIIKGVYEAIQDAAGDIDVIGCNTVSHLTAGIHSIYRTGDDTSGRNFELTRRNGVNSMMRLPLNRGFYNVDPDCAAFTETVDAGLNLDYLEMCAITGVTTLASVTPDILTPEQMERIQDVFKIADENECEYTIKNYDKNSIPDTFVHPTTGEEKSFDWYRCYNGERVVFEW